jgi:hypothetical protein
MTVRGLVGVSLLSAGEAVRRLKWRRVREVLLNRTMRVPPPTPRRFKGLAKLEGIAAGVAADRMSEANFAQMKPRTKI